MNIIFGKDRVKEVEDKYTVLELDTIRLEGSGVEFTAYALVESIPIMEMNLLGNYKKLHLELMENYRKQNWNFCEQALEHLQGRWNGEIDSFYGVLAERIRELKSQELPQDWDGVIVKPVVGA